MKFYLAFFALLETFLVSGQCENSTLCIKDAKATKSIKAASDLLDEKFSGNCTLPSVVIRQGKLTVQYCTVVKPEIADSLKRLFCRYTSPCFVKNADKKSIVVKAKAATIQEQDKVFVTGRWEIRHPFRFRKRKFEPINMAHNDSFPLIFTDTNFAKDWLQTKKMIKDSLSVIQKDLRSYQCYMFFHPCRTTKCIYCEVDDKAFKELKASRKNEKLALKKNIRHTTQRIRFTKRQLRKRSFTLFFETA